MAIIGIVIIIILIVGVLLVIGPLLFVFWQAAFAFFLLFLVVRIISFLSGVI